MKSIHAAFTPEPAAGASAPFSRRDFLSGAAVVGATLLVPGYLVAAPKGA